MGELLNRFEKKYTFKDDMRTSWGVVGLAGDTMKLRREIDGEEVFYRPLKDCGSVVEVCISMTAAVELQPFTETIQLPEGYYENIKKV